MKKQATILLLIFFCGSMLFIDACKKKDIPVKEPFNPTYLTLKTPAGWPPPPADIFSANTLTEEGFQLGKKLFYDGRLSKDGDFPCASCHQQFASFATYDHDFSHGYNNSFTTRNTPATFNLAWTTSFGWDGRFNNIEAESLTHITAPNEMAENIDSVILKLRNVPEYKTMFKAAFGDDEINSQRLVKAIAQFTGSIISSESKYDRVKRGQENFNSNEQNGYTIFKSKCDACHKEPLFTDYSFRNNGLALNSLNDKGRMRITGNSSDSLKFKVPTLRNIELTFPYMHDGRIYSLSQAIDHYRTGIITTQPTLDPLLTARITMTTTERNDLIYFLYTLSDSALCKNPRFMQ